MAQTIGLQSKIGRSVAVSSDRVESIKDYDTAERVRMSLSEMLASLLCAERLKDPLLPRKMKRIRLASVMDRTLSRTSGTNQLPSAVISVTYSAISRLIYYSSNCSRTAIPDDWIKGTSGCAGIGRFSSNYYSNELNIELIVQVIGICAEYSSVGEKGRRSYRSARQDMQSADF